MKERYFFDGWGPEQDHDLEAATHYHLRVVRDGPLIESWTGDRKDLASLQADYDAGVRQRAAALGRLRDAQEAATKDTIPEILEKIRENDDIVASNHFPACPVEEIPTPPAPFQIDQANLDRTQQENAAKTQLDASEAPSAHIEPERPKTTLPARVVEQEYEM